MLTKNQIEQFNDLIPTITESRYKTIITDAVENWKNSKNFPAAGSFGTKLVELTNNVFSFTEDTNLPGCCLLGAYNINKTMSPEQDYTTPYKSLLYLHETTIIINVFDKGEDHGRFDDEDQDLISLILKVRKIALEK